MYLKRLLALFLALMLLLASVPSAMAEVTERMDYEDGWYEIFYFASEDDKNNFNYSKSEYFNPDGIIASRMLRSFNEQGDLVNSFYNFENGVLSGYNVSIGNRNEQFNAHGQLLEYTIQNDNRSDRYSASGQLLEYTVSVGNNGERIFSPDGLLRREYIFDENTSASTYTFYYYNTSNQLTKIETNKGEQTDSGEYISYVNTYDGSWNLTGSTKSWDTKNGWRTEYYDASGSLLEYSLQSVLGERMYRQDYFNPSGDLNRYTISQWQDDRRTENTYDSVGTLLSYTVGQNIENDNYQIEYFDAAGKLLKTEVYNRFGDLISVTIIPQIKYVWYPHNTLTTFGLPLRDLRPELTDKWYNVTPVDLSKDGMQVLELVASNLYIIGRVYVNVKGDEVTVTYECKGMKNDTVRMESEFFTFFQTLEGITEVDPEKLGEGFKFGEALSIEKDLEGNTKPLLFVRNVATYRDHLTKDIKYVRLWPNQPHRKEMRQQMLTFIGK